jgi:hypothetical protein
MLCLFACLLVLGCDPSDFDDIPSKQDAAASSGESGGKPELPSAGRAGHEEEEASAGVAGELESSAGGFGATGGLGDHGSPEQGGASGAAAVGGMSGAAAVGGMSGAAAAGGRAGSSGNGGASGAPASTACPKRPNGLADGFCYDFEQGVEGPNGGADYELWYTPDLFTSAELSIEQRPTGFNNNVLRTAPPMVGEYPSATVGRDTPTFAHARVEFDIIANDTLVNSASDIAWFRFLPNGEDFDRLTQLVFRRGQALVRAEGSSDYRVLQHLPRTDGTSTHVSIVLDRRGPCNVAVYFDSEPVGSALEAPCIADKQGFVEYGLVVLQPLRAPVQAHYDNISVVFE